MLKELIRYTEVADLKIIETFAGADRIPHEAEALFSHVLNAQHIWINRIKGENQLYERFQIHPASTFMSIHLENIAGLHSLLSLDLNQMISYSNSQGELFENKTSDIVLHVINHSTYHRAQVATMFRQHNITPPVTDFISLKRDNLI